jgi:peptidoglycan/LPS O-acetylase OafA/YrhL
MVRIRELDGVRGIAILLVLLMHYIRTQIAMGRGLISQLTTPLEIAWSGVDLFFVLSGFLIVGILLDAKGSKTYFKTF